MMSRVGDKIRVINIFPQKYIECEFECMAIMASGALCKQYTTMEC